MQLRLARMDQPDGQAPQPLDGLQIVFYEPIQPQPTEDGVDNRPRWQQLADRIGKFEPAERIEVSSLTSSLGRLASGERPCQIALRLARSIQSSTKDKAILELIVVSFCFVLYSSGRAAPEAIDEILTVLIQSSSVRYLDQVKRGAKLANEIIAEWSMTGIEDRFDCLDRATQIILQGNLATVYLQLRTPILKSSSAPYSTPMGISQQ